MSYLQAVWEFLADVFSLFWLSVLNPNVNEPDEVARPGTVQAETDARAIDTPSSQHQTLTTSGLIETREEVMVVAGSTLSNHTAAAISKEDHVSDGSFLSQLEQRTQQVKITLANLEAEKARIEALIDRLQPLVPHYEALLAAERSIEEAHISLEPAAAASSPEDSWGGGQEEQRGWNG